jgi:bidirectional [NiFe] hydrogenase diaphorase subunit
MAVVTLTIDDELVSALDGENLLKVVREQGISLPTLCHLDGLSERGGCRLCIVEVEGVHRLQPACTTAVREGMVVRTRTDRVVAYRRMILELLFAERNHVCAVCVMNRRCELQAAAAAAGVDHVRYDYVTTGLPMDMSHERFGLDQNRCILCGRCQRVCAEVEGAHTWDVMGRGAGSRVITDLNAPWGESRSCTACGKCVQACPTGALFNKGVTAAEMAKEPGFLKRILAGREEDPWSR